MVDTSVKALRGHLYELALRLNFVFIEDASLKPEEGGATPTRVTRPEDGIGLEGKLGLVRVHPIIDDTTYAVALHEIGHLMHPTGSVRSRQDHLDQLRKVPTLSDMNKKLLEEESAWEWARRHALVWTVGMEQTEKFSLDSYVQGREQIREREELLQTMQQLLERESEAMRAEALKRQFARKKETLSDFLKRKK